MNKRNKYALGILVILVVALSLLGADTLNSQSNEIRISFDGVLINDSRTSTTIYTYVTFGGSGVYDLEKNTELRGLRVGFVDEENNIIKIICFGDLNVDGYPYEYNVSLSRTPATAYFRYRSHNISGDVYHIKGGMDSYYNSTGDGDPSTADIMAQPCDKTVEMSRIHPSNLSDKLSIFRG